MGYATTLCTLVVPLKSNKIQYYILDTILFLYYYKYNYFNIINIILLII